jgi:hypothetical protein
MAHIIQWDIIYYFSPASSIALELLGSRSLPFAVFVLVKRLTPKRPLLLFTLIAMIVTLATRSYANTSLFGAHKASIAMRRLKVHLASPHVIIRHCATPAHCCNLNTAAAVALQIRGGSSTISSHLNNSTQQPWRKAYIGVGTPKQLHSTTMEKSLHRRRNQHGHWSLSKHCQRSNPTPIHPQQTRHPYNTHFVSTQNLSNVHNGPTGLFERCRRNWN